MSIKKNTMRILIILICFLTIPILSSGQTENAIIDFYKYANKVWLDSTIVPENTVVVNNWGIVWDKITDKSIEILSGEMEYNLDQNHQNVLNQLQKYYSSAIDSSTDNRKRVELVQKYYPMLFGIIFSKITLSQEKLNQINELIVYIKTAYRIKMVNSNKLGN